MPPEIASLVAKPHLLLAVLLVGALIGVAIEQSRARMRRRAWRERNRWRWERKSSSGNVLSPWTPKSDAAAPKQTDAADQLRIVMNAAFGTRPLLNKSEARVFKELDRIVISRNP